MRTVQALSELKDSLILTLRRQRKRYIEVLHPLESRIESEEEDEKVKALAGFLHRLAKALTLFSNMTSLAYRR
jgi:hypothetical protein